MAEIQGELFQTIESIIDRKIKEEPYVVTKIGTIVSRKGYTYDINIEGATVTGFPLNGGFLFELGESVYVWVINNNYDNPVLIVASTIHYANSTQWQRVKYKYKGEDS